ncbi:RNA-directed DNA polymerase from mobile element jockey-like, partial [Brachionus plicatilis]
MVLEPNFKNNILDLIITSDPNKIYTVKSSPPLGSTKKNRLHNSLNFDFLLLEHNQDEINKKLDYNLRKCNFRLLNLYIDQIDWISSFKDKDVSEMYDLFIEKYHEGIRKHTPVKSAKRYERPKWMNRTVKALCRTKFQLWNKLRASNKNDKAHAKNEYKKF